MRLFAISRNATPGLPRIMRCKSSLIKPCSYTGLFRNTLRTGTLKNRSRITIVVPSGQPVSLTPIKRPPSISTFAPASASFVRVVIVTCETAAIDGSASPRKPSVRMSNSPSAFFSLLVAWFSNAIRASEKGMPQPLSVTRR